MNGLSDAEVVRALYRASEAGVRVKLIVRGICTLRPDIRRHVLEHRSAWSRSSDDSSSTPASIASRTTEMPEYFIGSSDLRPRNLRRRVELLVPVHGEADREQLDDVLQLYLADRTGWSLGPDGAYRRSSQNGPSAQTTLASDRSLPDPPPDSADAERVLERREV